MKKLFLACLMMLQSAWALDLMDVKVCEGSQTFELSESLQGTFKSQQGQFIFEIGAHGMEKIKRINNSQFAKDVEEDYCRIEKFNEQIYQITFKRNYKHWLGFFHDHFTMQFRYNEKLKRNEIKYKEVNFSAVFYFLPVFLPNYGDYFPLERRENF